jgi:RimJ/RimL family protein N-acetyltransferase
MPDFGIMGPLTTERLLIRPFVPSDLDAVHRLLDVDLDWAGDLEEREDWLRFTIRLAAAWANPPCGYRAITLKEDGTVVGKCGFTCAILSAAERSLFGKLKDPVEDPHGRLVLGVGYGLPKRWRRCGYATEAVRALIAHGFGALDIDALWARTTRDNQASVNLMHRVGMLTGVNPDPRGWPGVVGVLRNPGLTGDAADPPAAGR